LLSKRIRSRDETRKKRTRRTIVAITLLHS